MREQLERIIATPRELLHALALVLIGRRAGRMVNDHVVIPDDLSTAEFVFVAGLPALVAFGVLVAAVTLLFSTHTPREAGVATGVIIAAGAVAIGTIGDVREIIRRLSQR